MGVSSATGVPATNSSFAEGAQIGFQGGVALGVKRRREVEDTQFVL